MPCFHPLKAYQSVTKKENGKKSIVFNRTHKGADIPLDLPCGQCIGCRLERSRQWAVRCVHEASLYESNCFITLTYDDEHLPRDCSLHVHHFQKFMKRLRKKYGKMRFYHCGEYGSQFGRPHYHACLFGFDFPDKELFTIRDDIRVYTSRSLAEIWGKGFCTIGDVTFESAAYVARYIMKKQNGKNADDHYQWVDDYGVIHTRKPEYTTMSRRPGIGQGWFEKYKDEVYPHDRVVLRGVKMRPPKFYDTKYEIINPNDLKKIKQKREREAKKHLDDQTPDRLKVKEHVQELKLKNLPRTLT